MSPLFGSTVSAPALDTDALNDRQLSVAGGAAPACLNCGTEMNGRFCSSCGQGHVDRITMSTFAHELASQFLEVDRGLLHTFVDLLRAPGRMIREYIDGRRRSYTSPLGYILIASAFSLLRAALTPDTARRVADLTTSLKPTLALIYTPARLEMFLRIQSLITTNKFAMDAFLLVPIVLSLRFLFRKRDVNLAEITVFACYTFGQATLVTILLGLPLMLFASAFAYSAIFVTVTIGYLLYAGVGFFGSGVGTVFRLVGSVALGLILMNAATYALPFLLAR